VLCSFLIKSNLQSYQDQQSAHPVFLNLRNR